MLFRSFFRTPKCADKPAAMQVVLMAREEISLLAGLLVSAAVVLAKFTPQNHDAVLWAGMLLVQTLPYWAAVGMAVVNALPARSSSAA